MDQQEKKIGRCVRALLNEEAGSKSRKYAKSSKKLVVKCSVKVGGVCVYILGRRAKVATKQTA